MTVFQNRSLARTQCCNHNPLLLLVLSNVQAAVSSYLKGLENEALLVMPRLMETDDVHDL